MFNATKLGQKLPWNYKRYVLALIIFVLGYFPFLVSKYYLPYFFKPLSGLLRIISNIFEFAIGEWLYLFICISLIIKFVRFIVFNFIHFQRMRFWTTLAVEFLNWGLKWYILFELFWGLNYQKSPPSTDFELKVPETYSEAQMDSLSIQLITAMNDSRTQLGDSIVKYLPLDSIMEQSIGEYDRIEHQYPFLHYRRPALKKSAFPVWGDYFGYTAFYQPLTGEAIIRADLPILTQPFTVCHEIAHQLGYASETEANFIAFVIGTESKDPLFKYSSQLQLFTYAQQAELNSIAKRGDFTQFENVIARNKKLMNPKVLADRKIIREFFTRKQLLQIPGSAQLYNQFLLWNKQTKGLESYNDVLLWAIAYTHKKNP